jgi:cysteine desulfurase/selenocysteine lyase
MSNVLGTKTALKDVVHAAHAKGVPVLADGCQGAVHGIVDVQALDVDFYALSGHKMFAPTGIGVLWGRREVLEAMPPFLGGGEMIREVHQSGARWNDLPGKFEAGTPNIAGAIGLGAAIDYLQGVGVATVRAHETALTAYALEQLSTVDDLTIYGPPTAEARGGVVSFTLGRAHPHDIASILDEEDAICVRAGHHCCQPLMDHLGVAATTRASFHIYTLRDEIDRLVAGLRTVHRIFHR